MLPPVKMPNHQKHRCLHSGRSFPVFLWLIQRSQDSLTTPANYCQMKNPLPSPELHMGLVSDSGYDATVWFLASLPHFRPSANTVSIHFGLIAIGPVLLPLFFLRSSWDRDALLLETSLNPFQTDLQGLKLLRCLSSQDCYHIHCRDLMTQTEHSLNVPNTHQALYRQAVKLLERHPPWTATQFVHAQYHLAQSWATPEERFQNLRQPPGESTAFPG